MVATTGSAASPLYVASPLARVWVTVAECRPSATSSLNAVSVTDCGVLQSPVVKVRLIGAPATPPALLWASGSTVTTTLAVGWLLSRRV